MSDDKPMPAKLEPHRDKRPRLDDKYAEIDKRINSDVLVTEFIGHASDLSDVQLHLLLVVIGGHLDKPICFQDIEGILAEHQDIKDKIQTAWKAKSYQEILQLDCLQSFSGPDMASIEQIDWNTRYLEGINQVLRESWKLPYRGNYHKMLWEKINKMYGQRGYKNICAVIQSSGTGKSRTVDELAKLVYTLPINIRSRTGINAAYPPPDDVLRGYLVNQAPNNESGCRTHYETFFRCLFSYSLELLSNLNLLDDDLAGKWYELMDQANFRSEFYEHVVKLCKSPTDNQRTIKDLTTKLQALSANQKVRMVIYIDEAHELKKSCGGCTKLDILCLVIGDFYVEPLFFLLLSTELDFLVPAREATTSERARWTAGLLAPITETPFDCFLEDPIEPGVLRVEGLSTLDCVARWGRPLWWTMVTLGAVELISIARMKLMCDHGIDRSCYDVGRDALIAVLDVLLAFDFEPNCELSVDIQANLVTRHMRIAYSVPQHRLYFRSGYPSEPLLAEAAAQQLLKFKPAKGGCFGVMVDLLNQTKLLESTLIDAGQRGEVFMRVSLMGAYMDGVLSERGSEEEEGIIFSKGCDLITFIEQLFAPECARMILDARPDNLTSDMPFSQAFAHSMVRFTHFVKAGDQYQMTSEALFGAFIRGMAFIGYQTQQAVDFVIPVLLNEEDALEESAMSAILIQVRKRVKGRGPGMYTFCEDEVGLFPLGEDEDGKGRAEESLGDKRPYVTLVAEVGIEPKKGYVHVSPLPPSKHHADLHPRYAIAAYGCNGVYKSVDMNKHAFLLATRKFSAEHPDYQVDESRDLMMRLKPVWQRGENSYHWLDSKLLKETK